MKVGIVTEEARRGRVPEVQSSPGVMVVTSPGERVRQLLETFKLCRAQFSSAQLSSAQLSSESYFATERTLAWPDLPSWDAHWSSSSVLEIVDPARFVCCQTLLVLSWVWSGVCAPSVCAAWLCCSWWRTGDRMDRALWCPGGADGCEPSGSSRSRRSARRKDISVWSLQK